MKKVHKHDLTFIAIFALSIGAITIGLVMILNRRQYLAHPPAAAIAGAPSTQKPKQAEIDNYKVAPDLPRYLIISKLNVKSRVRSLGVDKTGSVGAPTNVYDTGWFNGSSKPGKAGAMLIDGHVSSWTTHGVFYDLGKLKVGDTFQVQRGDDKMFTYTVRQVKTYDADNVDMNAVLSPVSPYKIGLNLITCTGTVKKGTSLYTKRLVVFASQNT